MDGAGHLGRRRERTGSCQRLVPAGEGSQRPGSLIFLSPPLPEADLHHHNGV
jgi:hypothetical protein